MIEILPIVFPIIEKIAIIGFVIRTIRNALYHVFLWQLKEYRVDRMIVHLKTWQGRRWMFGSLSTTKWISTILYSIIFSLLFFGKFPAIVAESLVFNFLFTIFILIFIFVTPTLIYIVESLFNMRELWHGGWKIPVLTIKSLSVILLGFMLTAVLTFSIWRFDHELILGSFLIADKLLGPFIALLFIVLSIPTKIQRIFIIQKAKRMIQERPDLIVIGITGSYGKTSTKEYLAQILSQKYKVLKTEKSNNTDIGIAQVIVNDLKPEHEVFIVEMGAYKRGEIKTICEIVKPKIGIITAINEQHLDLFGSIENTMRAKYELIEALPNDGLAVFNGGNSYTKTLAQKTKLKTIVYKMGPRERGIDCWAENITVHIDSIQFTLGLGQRSALARTQLVGKQHIENILAAVAVSSNLGMNLKEVIDAVAKLTPPEKTMNLVKHKSGTYLVDDTFNVNPAAIFAALDYLSIHKGKKVLVLQPMIELGEGSEKAHQEIGKRAAQVCDFVILTNKNFYDSFIQGAKEIKNKKMNKVKIRVASGDNAVELLGPYLENRTVIVFESKEAGKILAKIL